MTDDELNKKSNKLGVALPITKTVEVGGKQVKIPQRFQLEEFKFGTCKLPQKYLVAQFIPVVKPIKDKFIFAFCGDLRCIFRTNNKRDLHRFLKSINVIKIEENGITLEEPRRPRFGKPIEYCATIKKILTKDTDPKFSKWMEN